MAGNNSLNLASPKPKTDCGMLADLQTTKKYFSCKCEMLEGSGGEKQNDRERSRRCVASLGLRHKISTL